MRHSFVLKKKNKTKRMYGSVQELKNTSRMQMSKNRCFNNHVKSTSKYGNVLKNGDVNANDPIPRHDPIWNYPVGDLLKPNLSPCKTIVSILSDYSNTWLIPIGFPARAILLVLMLIPALHVIGFIAYADQNFSRGFCRWQIAGM